MRARHRLLALLTAAAAERFIRWRDEPADEPLEGMDARLSALEDRLR